MGSRGRRARPSARMVLAVGFASALALVGGAVGFVTPRGGLVGLRARGAAHGGVSLRGPRLALGQGQGRAARGRARGALRLVAQEDGDEEEEEKPTSSGFVDTFEAGDITLMSGEKMKNVSVVYEVHGIINEDQSNVILHPTSFCATHEDARYRIGRGEKYTLDTTEHAVVVVNMLGNGMSTSPSHYGSLADWKYPTLHDNAKLHKRLLEEELGVKGPLKMIFGYSMGAMCALQYGALFPDKVKRIAAVCGTAKTTHYNRVFLKSLRSALLADPAWDPETETFSKRPSAGLRTFGAIYAGWGLSSDFYRQEEFLSETLGYVSLDDFLEDYIDTFSDSEAHNILAQLYTWDTADISNNDQFKGELGAALASIQAETWFIPSATDRYFTVADIEKEVNLAKEFLGEAMPNTEVRPISTTWGHRAGDPFRKGQKQQYNWISKTVHELLDKGVSASV